MSAPRSILWRILIMHGLATLVTAVVAAGGIAWLLDRTSSGLERQTLNAYAITLGQGLRHDAGGWSATEGSRASISGGGASFSFAVVEGERLRPIAGLAEPSAAFVPPVADTPRYFRRVNGRTFYSGVTIPLPANPRVWAVIVQDLEHPTVIFDDLVTGIAVIATIVILALLSLLLAIDVLIVRSSLAPVKRASRAVAAMRPYRPGVRIDVADLPKEVLPLAQAANTALDRVETAYRTEREFLDDTAHTLRTPLAVLRLRADELPDGNVRRSMMAQIDRLRTVVDGLLAIAEIDATAPKEPQMFDLRALAADRAAEIAPLAIGRGHILDVEEGDPIIVRTLPDNIGQALDAVLENAILHTPPGTLVGIRVTEQEIEVADNGPGISPQSGTKLFVRFWRGKETGGGTGLGLSVAMRLLQQAKGTLSYRPAPGGGSIFTLRIEAAADAPLDLVPRRLRG